MASLADDSTVQGLDKKLADITNEGSEAQYENGPIEDKK